MEQEMAGAVNFPSVSRLLLSLLAAACIAVVSGQDISPERFEQCIDNLAAADTSGTSDNKVSPEEFVRFIELQSGGDISVSSFADLPLGAISNFNFVACQCPELGDNLCCVGENARIDLSSPFVRSFLLAFCTNIDNVIVEVAGPRPTSPPTLSPDSTPPPTPGNLECTEVQYAITNSKNLTANDIFNRVGNTLADDLIAATQVVVNKIISDNFPSSSRLLRGLLSVKPGIGKMNQSIDAFPSSLGHPLSSNPRMLVELSDLFPIKITKVIDNPICQISGEDAGPGVLCALISSTVCVLLEDGDDPDTVRRTLIDGLRDAVNDGSFAAAATG